MKELTRLKIESVKEELLDFYHTHSVLTTASHFHISPSALKKWLKEQNLYEDRAAPILPAEEDVRELYIVQNLSKQEVSQRLNITIWTLSNLLKKYDICKSSKDIISARQKTCLEKYGVDNPSKAPETKDKILQTNHSRYGASSFTSSEKGKEAVKKTKLLRYGDATYNNAQKNLHTKSVRYGDPHYNNREKNKETCLNKYGVKNGGALSAVIAKARAATCERLNYSDLFKVVYSDRGAAIRFLTSGNYSMLDLIPLFNAPYFTIQQWVTRWDLKDYVKLSEGKSQYEDQLFTYLQSLGIDNIERHNRTICNGQELDLYLPEFKVAVEFNGEYWHNSTRLPKDYPYTKSKICEDQGIRLIHVYEHQWKDPTKQAILKSILKNALGKNTNVIYARKCEIRELKKKDVELFSQRNSLHGHRNASIYLGLFYQEELVEVMTFGKAYFSKDSSIDYECIRSITKLDTTVVGGMNKLFKYFISKWNPHKVLYYVDYNTHNGNSMGKLGFKFKSYSKHGIVNVSNCKEVTERFGEVFNRKPERNKEIQSYIKEGKIFSIYDAGVKKYIWESSSHEFSSKSYSSSKKPR
mgnify:CR=1 FL=1